MLYQNSLTQPSKVKLSESVERGDYRVVSMSLSVPGWRLDVGGIVKPLFLRLTYVRSRLCSGIAYTIILQHNCIVVTKQLVPTRMIEWYCARYLLCVVHNIVSVWMKKLQSSSFSTFSIKVILLFTSFLPNLSYFGGFASLLSSSSPSGQSRSPLWRLFPHFYYENH